MKLITFQSISAFEELKRSKILKASQKFVDTKKYGVPYHFLISMMRKRSILPEEDEEFPIWAWKKCANHIAPPKHLNKSKIIQKKRVKITFSKPEQQVLLSDYMAYSFILNGQIVPKTQQEYKTFLKHINNLQIKLEDLKLFIREEIKEQHQQINHIFSNITATWENIFNLKSNIQQACVWNIKLDEVEKIEYCDDSNFIYGTLNSIRSNGQRPNWMKRYLNIIPKED